MFCFIKNDSRKELLNFRYLQFVNVIVPVLKKRNSKLFLGGYMFRVLTTLLLANVIADKFIFKKFI